MSPRKPLDLSRSSVERWLAHQSLGRRPAALAVHRDGREVTAAMAAAFLAKEIHSDVMAKELEIEHAIFECIMAHRSNARIIAEDVLLRDFLKALDLTAKAPCQTAELAEWIRERLKGGRRLPERSMGSQERWNREHARKKRKRKSKPQITFN